MRVFLYLVMISAAVLPFVWPDAAIYLFAAFVAACLGLDAQDKKRKEDNNGKF